MKKSALLIVSFILISFSGMSQCFSGAIGVSGAGCGCLSGCDLTSVGGPNCSPSVGGNCSSGSQTMQVDIVVPDGCTYTITGEMQPRPGCSASGADGSDGMKIDIPGGPKPTIFGGSNASISDSYTLVGPGTIRVSGIANRADEIITYTVTSSGVFCVDCSSILPIELTEFNAHQVDNKGVELTWTTLSERDNDFFTIERSENGIDFEPYHVIDGQGTSTVPFSYYILDSSPLNGLSYYRLKQTDFDGNYTHSYIKSVYISNAGAFDIYPNPSNGTFKIRGEDIANAEINFYNSMGQKIVFSPDELSSKGDLEIEFKGESLAPGVYIIQIIKGEIQESIKLVID